MIDINFLSHIMTQCIIRNGKSMHVILKTRNSVDNPIGHEIILKIIYLALLPPAKFEAGLHHIKEEIYKNYKNDENWKNFMAYFTKEWSSEKCCVFEAVDRTNNHCESYHRTLNMDLGKAPILKKFIGKFVKLRIRISLYL